MDILYLLVPLSLALALLIGLLLWYAVRSDQFEDLEGEGRRVLLDDDQPPASSLPPSITTDITREPRDGG